MLHKVVVLWQATDFRLVPHASGQVSIISQADDILAMLEESQVSVRKKLPCSALHAL